MKLNTNRIIGLYAPQNYGKTFLMSWLLRQIPPTVKVYVFDTNFERLTAYPQDTPNIRFIKAQNLSDQENPAFLDLAILKLRGDGVNFILVIEDIDKIVSAIKSAETSELFKLASDSRHQRIGIIYATKEPTNIPKILRSNTNLFFFGNFIEPQNVKVLSQIVDKQTLVSLQQGEFIMLDKFDNTKTTVKLVNDHLTKIKVDINAQNVPKQQGNEEDKGKGGGDGDSPAGRTTEQTTGSSGGDTEGGGERGNDTVSKPSQTPTEHPATTDEPKPKGKDRKATKEREGKRVLQKEQTKGARQTTRKKGGGEKETTAGKNERTGKEVKRS